MTVGVLLIDASLLLDRSQEHAHGDAFLGAALLRRLQHSDLRVAICCPEGEVSLIEEAGKYSFEYIPCHGSSLGDSIDGLLQSSSGLACIYTTSRSDESLLLKLVDRGWKVILKSSEEICAKIEGLVTICKLEELMFAIHRIVKMEFRHMSPISVGYVMKPSRELDFAKALVFKVEHYGNLLTPLPAVIQEYVDHGSILYKFYVLGERIFHAVKKSMPNADILRLSSQQNGSVPIFFDSLKSLPTADIDIRVSKKYLDIKLAEKAATWLRKMLGLTIFGFDVVVQEGSGDHVIVDVNYLPSFKEIPDEEAIPAFWDAIRSSYESKKAKWMAE